MREKEVFFGLCVKQCVWLASVALLGGACLSLWIADIVGGAQEQTLAEMGAEPTFDWIWPAVFGALLGALLLFVAGFLLFRQKQKLGKKASWLPWVLLIAAVVLVPFALTLAAEIPAKGVTQTFEWMGSTVLERTTYDVVKGIDATQTPAFFAFLRGWAWLIVLYAVFVCLFNGWAATLLVGIPSTLLGVINYYKVLFRDDPVYPWDIFSITTFADVAGNYNFTITRQVVLALLIWVTLIVLCIPVRVPWPWLKESAGPKPEQKALASVKYFFSTRFQTKRFFALASTVVVAFLYFHAFFWSNIALCSAQWEPVAVYKNRGVVTAFTSELQTLRTIPPEGYSRAAIGQIIEEYGLTDLQEIPSGPITVSEENPNIIMILSESFYDLEEKYPDVTFDEELFPVLRELQETAVHGDILCPGYGGGTSQTEFEVLTGFKNQYLEYGVIPFTRVVTSPMFSIARILAEQGYETLSMHPQQAKNWNRGSAHPYLGIQKMVFEPDYFAGAERSRNWYVSDQALMEESVRQLEELRAVSDAPQFQFVLSVQNHGGYSAENLAVMEDTVTFDGPNLSEETAGMLADFASGLHMSDAALGWLIEYFEQHPEEPTIIVFFGDHQVFLGDEAKGGYNRLGEPVSYVDIQYDGRRTPFVMWSNFSDVHFDAGVISANNLSPLMMETYELPLPSYFAFLLETMEASPASIKDMIVHNDGTYSSTYFMTPEEEKARKDLQLIQYDYLFGKRYALALFETVTAASMEEDSA